MVRTSPFHGGDTGSIPVADIFIFVSKIFMDVIMIFSFIPEVFLSVSILFQLLFNVFFVTSTKNNFPILNAEVFSQTFFILLCLFFLFLNTNIEGYFLNFILYNDLSTYSVKLILVTISLAILSVIFKNFVTQKLNSFEFFTFFLLSLFSLLLLISVGDMVSAYLLMELQALSFYVLSGFCRDSSFSTEAGLKYFVSGSFISLIFLFGCSLIYGAVGTLNLYHLKLLFFFPFDCNMRMFENLLFVGILCVVITLLFKLSAAPFYFWSPDVYEGSPLASTIIFSIVPKFSIIYFFIRWLFIILPSFNYLLALLVFSGILSTFLGSFFAIQQKRLKRLFIYSSIAQTGFLIAGLSDLSLNGLISIYFFLFVYVITSILIWLHISFLYLFQSKTITFNSGFISSLYFSSFVNLFKTNKLWAFSIALIFFSIAGIPPFCGFFAKIFIVSSLISSKNLLTAFCILIISAVSAFYYLRIIKTIFFESSKNLLKFENSQIVFVESYFFYDSTLIAILLFFLVYLFFYPTFLLLICHFIVLNSIFF